MKGLASLEAKRNFRAPKVMPKCIMTAELPSPSSENHESDSPSSTEEITPTINHQHGSLSSKDLDEELELKDSLIFHQKQFRTPKIMPKCVVTTESLSPIPNSQNSSQNLPSKDSIEATFSNESNKTVELNLQGSSVTSLYSDESFRQNPAFDGDESNTKSLTRKVIKRSPYFQHKYDNEELSANRNTGDLTGDHPVDTVASIRNGYPKSAIKKRKLLHPHNTPSESEAGDQIDNSNGKVEGKFVCNVSHVDRYSGIAEKSMEKFASLITSFRYRGSRASGLRPPLKDIQNTCPVRSTVEPIDFGKYACKPKNKSV